MFKKNVRQRQRTWSNKSQKGIKKIENMKMEREKGISLFFSFLSNCNMETKRETERICYSVMYAHAVQMGGGGWNVCALIGHSARVSASDLF